jgi:AraC-like DNA-binding protein
MISYILFKYRSPLNIYLVAGTLLLALPSIFTAVVNQLEGKLGYTGNISLIRIFNFYERDFKLYMYHTRIGVILELICFVIALAYKNRWKIQQFQQSVKPAFPAPQEKVDDPLLTRIRHLILQHLDDDQYGIDELCQSLAISRAHLHNRIKKSMGLPTSHFIRNIRLEEGKNRLLTTNLNISEIAYAVGFSDPNYFTRIFTAYYGISPKRMREETEDGRRKTEDGRRETGVISPSVQSQ